MRPNLYIFICMKRKSINYISKHIWHVWCLGSSWEISEKFKMTWNDVAAAAISGSVWPCSGYQKTAAGNFLFFSQQVEQAFFVLWASFETCSYFAGAELCDQNQQCRFLGWVFTGYSVNSVQCSLGSFNLCQFDSQVHSLALDQYQVLPRFCFTTLMNTHCGAQIEQLPFYKISKT